MGIVVPIAALFLKVNFLACFEVSRGAGNNDCQLSGRRPRDSYPSVCLSGSS